MYKNNARIHGERESNLYTGLIVVWLVCSELSQIFTKGSQVLDSVCAPSMIQRGRRIGQGVRLSTTFEARSHRIELATGRATRRDCCWWWLVGLKKREGIRLEQRPEMETPTIGADGIAGHSDIDRDECIVDATLVEDHKHNVARVFRFDRIDYKARCETVHWIWRLEREKEGVRVNCAELYYQP